MKLLRWIVLPPIAVLAMALAVANRSHVTFSFDPFDLEKPAFAVDVPLFLIVLIAMFAGILLGVPVPGPSPGARRRGARRRPRQAACRRSGTPTATKCSPLAAPICYKAAIDKSRLQ